MNVIHLSLGTEREQDRRSLERLCRSAHDKGIIIAAAARNHDDIIFPAIFETVIGVYWNKGCEPGAIIHHPGNPIEFGAWGHPRPLPGLDQKRNFSGSSFAVAHVSVRAARILEERPGAGPAEVKRLLSREVPHELP